MSIEVEETIIEVEGLKNDTLIKVFVELGKIKGDSRLLILVTNGFLELLVNNLIDTKCKNAKRITSNHRDYPYSAKLLLLNEIEVLPDDVYQVLDWLRKLWNRAAHEPLFDVAKSDLTHLKNQNWHDPSKLYNFCAAIIGSLWNEHLDVFVPVFAPSLSGKAEEILKST